MTSYNHSVRGSAGDPFRPVNIRAIYDDEDNSTVIVVWDIAFNELWDGVKP